MKTRIELLILFLIISFSCNKNPDDNTINVFPVSKDIDLGKQISEEIAADTLTYPILSESLYPVAYQHINRIKDSILNSGEVFYKDDFAWEVKIIHDDSVLNAFCTPGGYIYVYTGIIKYLDTEDQFAGVLAHEVAHADRRHSTDQLTEAYGIQLLLNILVGNDNENESQLANIAASLLTLKFSRNAEEEADEFSVKYLCPSNYKADGAAGFFQKLLDAGTASIPQFLSTHPSPDNRVESIKAKKDELGCLGTESYITSYQELKNSLP